MNEHAELSTGFSITTHLCGISQIRKDLGCFLTHKLLSLQQGKQIAEVFNKLCKDLAPHALSITESFGIPENQFGPIAMNWHDYNVHNNEGEMLPHYPLTR